MTEDAADFRIEKLEEQLVKLEADFEAQTGSHKAAVHRQIVVVMDRIAELKGTGAHSVLDEYEGRGGKGVGGKGGRGHGRGGRGPQNKRDTGVSTKRGKRASK